MPNTDWRLSFYNMNSPQNFQVRDTDVRDSEGTVKQQYSLRYPVSLPLELKTLILSNET